MNRYMVKSIHHMALWQPFDQAKFVEILIFLFFIFFVVCVCVWGGGGGGISTKYTCSEKAMMQAYGQSRVRKICVRTVESGLSQNLRIKNKGCNHYKYIKKNKLKRLSMSKGVDFNGFHCRHSKPAGHSQDDRGNTRNPCVVIADCSTS